MAPIWKRRSAEAAKRGSARTTVLVTNGRRMRPRVNVTVRVREDTIGFADG